MTKQTKRNIDRVYQAVRRLYKVHSDKLLLKKGTKELLHQMPTKAEVREQYLSMKGYSFSARKEKFLRDPVAKVSAKTESKELHRYRVILERRYKKELNKIAEEKGINKDSASFEREERRVAREINEKVQDLEDKLSGMSTRDYADLVKEDIMQYYNDKLAEGWSSKDISRKIASMYFGS